MDYEELRLAAHRAYRDIAASTSAGLGVVRIGDLQRALGDAVSREAFDEPLLRLDRERVVSLMRGSAAGLPEEQRQGAIEDPKAGFLFFIDWRGAEPR